MSANYIFMAMKSPGGRSYRFSMERNKINTEYLNITNPKIMIAYLEKLKQQGLKPVDSLGPKNQEQATVERTNKRKPLVAVINNSKVKTDEMPSGIAVRSLFK